MESSFPIHRIIIVYPEIKKKFGLNSDQYAVIDSIRILSSGESHEWCTQKKDKIAEYCAVSRASAYRAINEAVKKGLVVIHPDHKTWMKTVPEWNQLVLGLKHIWEEEKNGHETKNLNLRLLSLLQAKSQIETEDLSKKSHDEIKTSQDEIKPQEKQSQSETDNKIDDHYTNTDLLRKELFIYFQERGFRGEKLDQIVNETLSAASHGKEESEKAT